MILDVKSPILGFENIKTMELVKIDDFFSRLLSKDDDTIFTVINPYALRDYDFEIPQSYIDMMNISDSSELKVYNIVALSTPLEKSSVNFIAPIVINSDNNTMSQVVLSVVDYPNYGQAEIIENFLNK